MLAFFPTPYPDELFYSLCARYHEWSRNPTTQSTIEDLFNPKLMGPRIEFPSGLNVFCSNLSPSSTITPEFILYNHTFFPLYQPFIPQERAGKVMKEMFGTNSAIHRVVGKHLDKQKIEFLRFCKTCTEHDIEKFGEPYWHRCHQEYAVKICPHHNTCLYESGVPISRTKGGSRHFTALDESIIERGTVSIINDRNKPLFLKLAKDFYWLLNNENTHVNLNEVKERLRVYLIRSNCMTEYGQIKKEFLQNFKSSYSSEVLEITDADFDCANSKSWVHKMIHNYNYYFKPVRFLLLLNFLEVPISTFFKTRVRYEPFGQGPWLCLNPSIAHYNHRIIENINTFYNSRKKQTFGIFKCSCGFIYLRSNKTSESDIDKILQFGPYWEKELIRLVDSVKLDFENVGLLLKEDSKKLREYYRNLTESGEVKIEDTLKLKKRDSYRKLWLQKRKENPHMTRSKFYEILPVEYTWLRINDIKWLANNLPPKQNKRDFKRKERIDWKSRDQELSNQVINIAQKINSIGGKPIKITKTAIMKEMKDGRKLEWLEKLPITKMTLNEVMESTESFLIRKVKWAVNSLYSNNKNISKTSISKLIGDPKVLSETLERLISEQVEKYN